MKKLTAFALLTVLLLGVGIAIAATGSGRNFTTTGNLHLLKPIPGITGALGVEPSGTSWMELQNRSLDLIDAHNHSPGNGAPVPTSGININADLGFNSFNATLLRSLRLNSQASTLGGAGDLRAVYSVLGDLYWNNAAGTPIQITSGSGIAGTPGSIGGLASPASATYSAGTTTFTFQSATNTAASGDFGTIVLREKVANALGITLKSPTGLAGAYSLTMPSALPASDGILRLSTTGALSAFGTISGTNLTLPGSTTISGLGQTSASFNTAGALGGSILLQDTGGGVGNGGAVVFGFGQGYFAAIKGFGTNGTGNTVGDMVFATRAVSTDATLTERMRVTNAGVAIGGGTAISGSFRGTAVEVAQVVGANTCLANTITVTGAVAGADCAAGVPGAPGQFSYTCNVSAANTCIVNACNINAIDHGQNAGTYSCRAWNP